MLKCQNVKWTPLKCEQDRRPDRVITPCVGVMEWIVKSQSRKLLPRNMDCPEKLLSMTKRTGVVDLPRVILYCLHEGNVANMKRV